MAGSSHVRHRLAGHQAADRCREALWPPALVSVESGLPLRRQGRVFAEGLGVVVQDGPEFGLELGEPLAIAGELNAGTADGVPVAVDPELGFGEGAGMVGPEVLEEGPDGVLRGGGDEPVAGGTVLS